MTGDTVAELERPRVVGGPGNTMGLDAAQNPIQADVEVKMRTERVISVDPLSLSSGSLATLAPSCLIDPSEGDIVVCSTTDDHGSPRSRKT